MATTYPPTLPSTTDDGFDGHAVVLLGIYAALLLSSVAAATTIAFLLAGFAGDLAGYVALAAGWLTAVSAAPALARRATDRIAGQRVGRALFRPVFATDAVVTSLLTR